MITKKTPAEIETLARGGRVLATILESLSAAAHPGTTTLDLNDRALALCEEYGAEPVLLGYHPEFAPRPYPAAICTSVNDVVQHGIPDEAEVLADGDVLDIDMSIGYEGLIVDAGCTVPVGTVDERAARLIAVTRESLARGIAAAVPGGRVGDIGYAIHTYVSEKGFATVEALCGHGVGYAVHEEPQIPNFGRKGAGPKIEVGHVYAIEPIVNAGRKDVLFDDAGDGYTVYTQDGSLSAHFEHTVAITEDGPRILTHA